MESLNSSKKHLNLSTSPEYFSAILLALLGFMTTYFVWHFFGLPQMIESSTGQTIAAMDPAKAIQSGYFGLIFSALTGFVVLFGIGRINRINRWLQTPTAEKILAFANIAAIIVGMLAFLVHEIHKWT